MNVPVSTMLTFPPISPAPLWDPSGDPPDCHRQGCVGTHCSRQDITSNGEHPAPAAFPKHSWASAALSAALPERNAFSLHLGVQTIHQQEWQQNNTNTSRLQSAQRYTNTLTSKVLPGLRDAEDKRLKTCSKMRLKSLPCFTASGKTPATFLKTSTLQEVKITLQTCLVVCCTQRVDQEKYRTKEYKIRSKT